MKLNWRSGLVMTAGVTCAECFRQGRRDEGSRIATDAEMKEWWGHGYNSPRYHRLRRAAFRQHLKAHHPELLERYF